MEKRPPVKQEIKHGFEEEPQQKMECLQQKVWDNLRTSGLLLKILDKSAHAAEEKKYTGVELCTEIGTSRKDFRTKMWLQIYIKHINHHQPVTPKLYRLTNDPREQEKISAQIWEGITEDDIRFIAKHKANDYYARDQKGWLSSQDQHHAINVLYPAISSGNIKIELIPEYAQYSITVEKLLPHNSKVPAWAKDNLE